MVSMKIVVVRYVQITAFRILSNMADNHRFQFVFSIEFLLQKKRQLQLQQQLLFQVAIALYLLTKLFLLHTFDTFFMSP